MTYLISISLIHENLYVNNKLKNKRNGFYCKYCSYDWLYYWNGSWWNDIIIISHNDN